ncbi:MAG: hypothetical protein ABI836_14630 [Gemmatimonadota bacterium]
MSAPRGVLGVIVLSSVLAVGHLEGQIREVNAHVGERSDFRFQAGGHLALAFPQGQFSEFVDLGYGLGGWVAVNLDREGMVALKMDGSFLIYGHESRRRPLSPSIPFVSVDVSTSNNIYALGFGPLITLGHGAIRPYFSATAGFSYFATESSVKGSNNTDSFAESTNFDDFTFAWTAGGGLRIRVNRGRTPVFIDMASEYHRNGRASYLTEGSITDNGNGSITIHPIESETNLMLVKLGVSASF